MGYSIHRDGSLTIRDFLPLLFDYMENNIATEVAVVTNDAFPRPNVTACITHYSFSLQTIVQHMQNDSNTTCVECVGLRNRSWDVWRDSESIENDQKLAEALLKRLLDDERDKGFPSVILNQSNFNWNQPLMDSLSYLFCYYGRLDQTHLIGDWRIYTFCETNFNMSNVGALEDEDLDLLYRLYMDGIQIYLRNSGDLDDSPETDLESAPDLLTRSPSLFGNYFCAPTIPTYSGEVFTWQSFPNDTDEPPWKRSSRYFNTIVKDDTVMYTYVPTTDAVYQTGKTRLQTTFYEPVLTSWEVRTRIVDQRPQKSCSTDSNAARCWVSNQLQATLEYCRCTPFTYRRMVAVKTLPYCNNTHYFLCENRLRELMSKHKAVCDKTCEYTVYDWQHFLVEYPNEGRDMTLWFSFIKSTKKYVEFRINPKTTPEMFISQIGGVVNFYLGFDGLTLCAILIFFVDILRRFYRRTHTQSNEYTS